MIAIREGLAILYAGHFAGGPTGCLGQVSLLGYYFFSFSAMALKEQEDLEPEVRG